MKSGRTHMLKGSPTKANAPGLKISTSTTGRNVSIESPAAAEHYVGQVNLPLTGTKSPPSQPPLVATTWPYKQSVPVPNSDDDDDHAAFSRSARMGGISGDHTSNSLLQPPPQETPPPPSPSPTKTKQKKKQLNHLLYSHLSPHQHRKKN
ncbi:unnamed protein product [Cylindrotheca closterium]|uniref:Uncharacterized protein n=1 Tax=Cylindrotheca closterium TaxID=2856 RepID=A0AAD2CBH7_9STRA|nr:unnamed protein product [Cylindrotheca closterium]